MERCTNKCSLSITICVWQAIVVLMSQSKPYPNVSSDLFYHTMSRSIFLHILFIKAKNIQYKKAMVVKTIAYANGSVLEYLFRFYDGNAFV